MRAFIVLTFVAIAGLTGACSSSVPDAPGGGSSSSASSSGGTSSGSTSSGSASSGASGATSGGSSSGSSGASSGTSGSTGDAGADATRDATADATAESGADTGADAIADAAADANDGGDPITTARLACLQSINGYRATLGRSALTLWPEPGESCASDQAMKDAVANVPHGAFGQCSELAQNECSAFPPGPPGTMIVGCLAQMWAEGAGGGDYENMAAANRTQVACGFYQTAGGSWWATQNFR